jgi:hypothetical protein
LLALVALAPAADPPADWAWVQPFRAPSAGPARLALPLPLLDVARPDLADLRLLDADGQPVAFALERAVAGDVRSPKSCRVTVHPEATVALLELAPGQPVAGIVIHSPSRAFLKSVTVEGSQEGRSWQVLEQHRPVFRHPSGDGRPEVPLEPGSWRWLRVSLDDRRSPPIPLDGVAVRAARGPVLPTEAIPVEIAGRSEEGGATRLDLRLPAANLLLAELALDTPEAVFSQELVLSERRCVEGEIREVAVARGAVQRLPDSGGGPAVARFEPPALVPSRQASVLLRHDDGPALRVDAVKARRRVTRLLCVLPKPGEYRLAAGNPLASAPRQDLDRLQEALKDAPVLAAAFGPLARNPAFAPSAPMGGAPLAGAPLDPKDWPCRKAVRLERGGAQALELDPDVLRRSWPAFQDLRLLRGGQQVPWVLERASATRELAVAAAPADDPKRPSTSRWKLALPAKRLPLARLSCEAPAGVFQRGYSLVEDVPDERGETHRRLLAHGTWTGPGPGGRGVSLGIASDVRPETDTLFLEVDNGDNPPLRLDGFKASHPLVRVVFMAEPGADLFLYYGLPSAPSPRYDLALVAARLVTLERSLAKAGPEEPLKESPAAKWLGGKAGVAFWGALALAVVVLLAAIVRLVPAQPPPKP